VKFDTYSVNPEVYLPWLKSQLEGRGVKFVRRRVHSLDEVCELAGENGVVINATGLGEAFQYVRHYARMTVHLRCTLPSRCGGYESGTHTGTSGTGLRTKRQRMRNHFPCQ